MNLTFTGGAREVGASCYLLEIDGKNILLDCGIRMKGSDSLPDFRLIQEKGGIDAVIISHAHLDHSGSLPVISREYPGARICMTHASKALIQVLLYDSLKIMERGDEIPIYAEKHVQEMLDRIICYSPQFSFKPIPESDIKVTFYNAGHIAGAALVYIEGEEGTLLYTGDFSATDQQSVIGGSVPKLRPDVMISESTYGDKLHSNRENEEKRLVDTVREVMNREGKMLIPAFALGRAQEIILILRKAMNKNQLPEFNIYVDGMVRDINRIYKSYPNYLKSNLANKIFRGNDIFYNDNVIEIEDREMREKVAAADGPYCIVSSSGMLKGGPSCFYAETVAEAEKNFIAITGYQDEETPGSDVLELLEEEPEERELEINNNTIDLNCEIGEYGLSAHADKGELTGLVHRVTPRKLFLVHGNQKTIQELAVDLNQEIFTEIYVPANGETFTADFNNPRKQLDYTNNLDPLSSGEKLNENNIEELWQYIYERTVTDTGYSIEELIYIQEGKENFYEENIEHYRELLNESFFFTPNRRRLFLYHPISKSDLKEQLKGEEGPMEMNQMLDLIEEYLPPESGLYKKGARIEENKVLLNFKFPDIARKQYQEEIEKIEEESGWEAEINDNINQVALENMVYRLIPPEYNPDNFSFYHNKKECEVELTQKPNQEPSLKKEFKEKTGVDLILNYPGKDARKDTKELDIEAVNRKNLMEQNQAFSYITDRLEDKGVKIYKKSRKEDRGIPYIELFFITPEVGERYQETIENLEKETGWNIVIGENPIQNEILKIARRLCIRQGMSVQGNPSFYSSKKEVEVKVIEKEEDKIEEIKEKFKNKTRYELNIKE